MRFDYKLLKSYTEEHNITLLKDYSEQELTRETIIEGKCINCGENTSKKFRSITNNSWCRRCSSNKNCGKKNNKITIEYCKVLAKEKKGDCLSNIYKSKKKLLWTCEIGHHWESRIDRVQSGRWCNQCYLLKVKPTIEKFKNFAVSKDGECLSDKYIDSKTELEWRCKRNHTWKSTPNTTFWCRECSVIDSYTTTLEDCKIFALNNNGECLSNEYKSRFLMKWKCKEGHEWESNFRGQRSGWCRECINIEQKKYNIGDCISSANIKGGECLSKEYINCDIPMKWKCKEGHEWQTKYYHILKGSWCKKCWGFDNRLGLSECIDWANKLDGECLSIEYVNKDTLMKWKCKEGHEWTATFGSLRNMNSWCRRCSYSKGYSKEQIQWLKYLTIYKNIQHAETEEGEYKIPNTKYSVDGYDILSNTIYEYHGLYFHGDIRFYHPDDINPTSKIKYGKLLKNTIKKELILRKLGYNYVCVWGYDWVRGIKAIIQLQKTFRNKRKILLNT